MKCPKCGAENSLRYQSIQQYAYDHKILNNGTVGKKKKIVYIGPEDWGCVYCKVCSSNWTDDEYDFLNGKLVFEEDESSG